MAHLGNLRDHFTQQASDHFRKFWQENNFSTALQLYSSLPQSVQTMLGKNQLVLCEEAANTLMQQNCHKEARKIVMAYYNSHASTASSAATQPETTKEQLLEQIQQDELKKIPQALQKIDALRTFAQEGTSSEQLSSLVKNLDLTWLDLYQTATDELIKHMPEPPKETDNLEKQKVIPPQQPSSQTFWRKNNFSNLLNFHLAPIIADEIPTMKLYTYTVKNLVKKSFHAEARQFVNTIVRQYFNTTKSFLSPTATKAKTPWEDDLLYQIQQDEFEKISGKNKALQKVRMLQRFETEGTSIKSLTTLIETSRYTWLALYKEAVNDLMNSPINPEKLEQEITELQEYYTSKALDNLELFDAYILYHVNNDPQEAFKIYTGLIHTILIEIKTKNEARVILRDQALFEIAHMFFMDKIKLESDMKIKLMTPQSDGQYLKEELQESAIQCLAYLALIKNPRKESEGLQRQLTNIANGDTNMKLEANPSLTELAQLKMENFKLKLQLQEQNVCIEHLIKEENQTLHTSQVLQQLDNTATPNFRR